MDDNARAILAESIHTAFRKGADSEQANKIWHLIRDMPDWGDVVDWTAWALEESGYQLVKKPPQDST